MDFMIEQIKKELQRSPSRLIGENKLKTAAVCIPIVDTAEGPAVLFEVRSKGLRSQPADICFPGGMLEEGETIWEAALRELTEELLVTEEQTVLLGASDTLVAAGVCISSFAVYLKDYALTASPHEVAEVFTVPLAKLMEQKPEKHTIHFRPEPPETFPFEKIYGGANYRWRDRSQTVYFYEADGRWIWGITAKLLHAFLMKQKGEDYD